MSKVMFALIVAVIVSTPANAVRDGIKTYRASNNFANLVRITIGNQICTGTRITFDTVLTAAHCFWEGSARSKFKVEYLDGFANNSEKIRFSDVIVKSKDLDEELAVFKINPLSWNEKLFDPTVIYDYKSRELNAGDKFILAGYGMDNSESTDYLKYGTLKYSYSKSTSTTIKTIDTEAMEVRNNEYLAKLEKEAATEPKKEDLPELELADCNDMNLGRRMRRSCRINNNNLIYQRDQKLKSIAYLERQKEQEKEIFLKTPIYKTTLSRGFEMLVMLPLERSDEMAKGEVTNNLPCPGDSGGPLYKKLPDGSLSLIAIISHISAPPGVSDQVGEISGDRICAKATSANYIPLSKHEDFLRTHNIIF